MVNNHWLNVVLVTPEIPGNTGSIGRTCLALNIRLILIKPYGFELSEKALRRAGLDYWQYLELTEYQSWQDFISSEKPQHLIGLSANATKTFFSTQLQPSSYLVFGPESRGLPLDITSKIDSYKLPIVNEHVRSLNLSNAVTTCCYEAFRQLNV